MINNGVTVILSLILIDIVTISTVEAGCNYQIKVNSKTKKTFFAQVIDHNRHAHPPRLLHRVNQKECFPVKSPGNCDANPTTVRILENNNGHPGRSLQESKAKYSGNGYVEYNVHDNFVPIVASRVGVSCQGLLGPFSLGECRASSPLRLG